MSAANFFEGSLKLVDYFTPANMRNDSESQRRARLFVVVCAITVLFTSSMMVNFGLRGVTELTSVILPVGLVFLLLPFLLRAGVPFIILVHITGGLSLINFMVSVYKTGGFDSPGIIWFSILPMICLLLTNLKQGLPWVFISIAAYLWFYLAKQKGVVMRNILPQESLDFMNLSLYIGFTILVFFIVVAFERTLIVVLQKLSEEKRKSDGLLHNILPEEVAEELKLKGNSQAKLFNDVTVLFTDFVGFTHLSEQLSPQELVDELHACFKGFDEITAKHGIEKIKTVGDAYLAASGLPVTSHNHADTIVQAALEIKEFMARRLSALGHKTFQIRLGIHSGPVVAGIVGVKKFAYDIWGDTVNTAARMEQNSEPGKITISDKTYQLVKDKFSCEYRGEIEAKNKGRLKMYFVER